VRVKITTVQDRQQCEALCQNMLDHVLFATDFSDHAHHAFKTVEELARHGVKRITLMTSRTQAAIKRHLEQRLAEFNEIDSKRLDRLKADLMHGGPPDVRCEITYGSPVSEILKRRGKTLRR